MTNLRPLWALFLILNTYNAMAQDERYFREMITGEHTQTTAQDQAEPDIETYSKAYELDLTGDHRFERVVFERRDGVDWVVIYNYQKELIFEYELDTQAGDSRVYKLKLNDVSQNKRLLTLYFYEGLTDYLELKSNSRLYFLTYDVNDIEQIVAQKGPVIWEEFSNKRGHYRQRPYEVSLVDLDSSNVKEVLVNYRTIRRVYRLNEEMKWIEM